MSFNEIQVKISKLWASFHSSSCPNFKSKTAQEIGEFVDLLALIGGNENESK